VEQTTLTGVAEEEKHEKTIMTHTHTHYTHRDESSMHICLLEVGMTSQASHKLFVSFQSSNLYNIHTRTMVLLQGGASPGTALDSSVVF